MKVIKDEKPKTLREKIDYWLGYTPRSHVVSDDGLVHFYNWGAPEMEWFYKFIQNNVDEKKEFNFFSVGGNKLFCDKNQRPRSIFYSAETVHTHKPFLEYRDFCLKSMDLSMTFDRAKAANYLRFPNWLTYVFPPEIPAKDKIAERVAEVNAAQSTGKYEAVIISNHDGHNTRGPVCDSLKNMLSITYGGKWRNNTQELWKDYDNNKIRYVREFKFNICPENRNVKDYVTEKIFEAFMAGSIPIYYGAKGEPEPGIINPQAFLYWDVKRAKENAPAKERIKELLTDKRAYGDFMRQEKLLPYTVDYVYETFRELRDRLNAM